MLTYAGTNVVHIPFDRGIWLIWTKANELFLDAEFPVSVRRRMNTMLIIPCFRITMRVRIWLSTLNIFCDAH